MRKSYILDSFRFIAFLTTATFSFIVTIGMLTVGKVLAVQIAIFALIAIVFSYQATVYGKRITVTDDSVQLVSLFGKKLIEYQWSDIEEIGIAGTKLFPRSDKGRRGTLYIYISDSVMDENELFGMMLKFPPKDKIVLKYKKERLNTLRAHFEYKITKYNTGSAKLPLDN